MITLINPVKITLGDTLQTIWARSVHPITGEPLPWIAGDTVTFRMVNARDDTDVVQSGASATLKQGGDGIARITAITQADPPVITTAAVHGLSSGDLFYLDGRNMLGAAELSNRWFEVTTGGSTTTLPLLTEKGTNYEAWSSGGFIDTRGLVSYDLVAADVDAAGDYRGQWIVTRSAETLHFPPYPGFPIEIEPTI